MTLCEIFIALGFLSFYPYLIIGLIIGMLVGYLLQKYKPFKKAQLEKLKC